MGHKYERRSVTFSGTTGESGSWTPDMPDLDGYSFTFRTTWPGSVRNAA